MKVILTLVVVLIFIQCKTLSVKSDSVSYNISQVESESGIVLNINSGEGQKLFRKNYLDSRGIHIDSSYINEELSPFILVYNELDSYGLLEMLLIENNRFEVKEICEIPDGSTYSQSSFNSNQLIPYSTEQDKNRDIFVITNVLRINGKIQEIDISKKYKLDR